MPKHIFLDLDDTLTPSRSAMRAEHVPLFERLCDRFDVIVVTGARESQMMRQLPASAAGKYFKLSQNGNHATDRDGSVLWSERFTAEQVRLILDFISRIQNEIGLDVSNEHDLVENRGSQISYSLIGHSEIIDKKQAFDPDGSYRRDLLARHAAELRDLAAAGIEITIGGTTCLDIFLLGKNKGFHVPRLIEHEGWKREESIYFGDALAPGRNDETVIGVIPTKSVTGPDQTFEIIAKMLT